MTSVISSRGCTYRCIFCDKSLFGRTFRAHSPEYVVNEIEFLIDKYKIREIDFEDDNFMLNPRRVEKIADLIIDRDLDITWQCQTRVDRANLELFKKLRRSGCWLIYFGIESGNQNVLNFINKKITLEQVQNAVMIAKQAGIQTWGYFMFGHPIDTRETMEDTLEFAKSLPLDMAGFNITVPYPGSELYSIAQNYGKFDKSDYKKYLVNSDEPVFVPSTTTEKELLDLYRRAHKEFFFRPSYIFQQLMNIRNTNDIKRYLFGAIEKFKCVL